MVDWGDKFSGVLLGMAVGDAIGLPREGLSGRRATRLFGEGPLEHRLVLGRGMMSDDTEHACMTGQALLASGGDAGAFARSLGWRLRGWLLGISAGVGFATLRSIFRLWCGFSPARSGVRSAGNGPAMRAPVLGVWAAAAGVSEAKLREFVEASTRITHADPRAAEGAMVVATVTREAAARGDAGLCDPELMSRVLMESTGEELRGHLRRVVEYVARGATAEEFARAAGMEERGVSGYINHTVPVAVFCCLRWPGDFRAEVEAAVRLGGDTDTVAAIVGGIMGAALGVTGVPVEWVEGLLEWPRTVGWLKRLGQRLAAGSSGEASGPLALFWPALLARNVLFAAIVILHGFRRLLPPY